MRCTLLIALFFVALNSQSQNFKVGFETRDKKSNRSLPAIISVRATNSEVELKGQMLDQQYVVSVLPNTEYQIVAAYQEYHTYRRTLNFENATPNVTQPFMIDLVSTKEPTPNLPQSPTAPVSKTVTTEIIEKPVVRTPTRQSITFQAVDALTNQPVVAKFKLTDDIRETFSGNTTTNSDFEATLPIQNEPFQLTVAASGYRTYQESISLKKALNQNRKVIKLSKADVMVIVNVLDDATSQPLKATIRVMDSENNRAAVNAKDVPNAVMQIRPEGKYIVEIESAGYLPISKPLSELLPNVQNSNSITLKLKKYNQDSYITLSAINASTGKPISATFKLVGKESQQSFQVATTQSTPVGKFKLTEPDTYQIETIAAGFKKQSGSFDAEEITIGQDLRYEVKLLGDVVKASMIVFNFQVTDAANGRNISGVLPKIINQKNRQITATKIGSSGFVTELEADNNYLVEVDAAGYDRFSMKFEASSGGRSVFPISMNPTRKPVSVATPTPTPIVAASKPSPVVTTPPASISSSVPVPTKTTAKKTVKQPAKPVNDNIFDNIKAGQSLTVEDNVYFDQSSYILRYESYPQLDRLVSMLWKYPKLAVEIIGHTDDVGDSRLNLILSENRSKVIANYIMNKGIKEDRIIHTGRGQTKPLVGNDSEENKKRNRRVEFIIK